MHLCFISGAHRRFAAAPSQAAAPVLVPAVAGLRKRSEHCLADDEMLFINPSPDKM